MTARKTAARPKAQGTDPRSGQLRELSATARRLPAHRLAALLEWGNALAGLGGADTPPPIPAGLVAAFTLIRQDSETAIAPVRHAEAVYPYAQRIIRMLHGESDVVRAAQDAAISDQLLQATDAVFTPLDQPPHDDPSMVAEAGFYVGFAACWLLMAAVNGKDGAR